MQFKNMKKYSSSLLSKCILFGALVLIFMALQTDSFPAASPEEEVENMRQIPQWHCLRYRKLDLIKRCRSWRLFNKTKY